MNDPDPLAGLDDDVRSLLAGVLLVVLDVDGVLTDARVIYAGAVEQQHFDVRDGQGLVWLRSNAIEVAWISGRGCAATERRARELDARLVAGTGSKRERLASLQAELGIDPQHTLAMGDDLPDLGLAARAGLFCAPADARPEIRARARLVTRASGGRGAVRELCEAILAAKELWRGIVGGADG